jgi:hypothetical protein
MVAVIEMDWQDILDGKPFPESPARTAFREAVETIADKARTAIPSLNGRVERAVQIIFNGDLSIAPDGQGTIASQSNGNGAYHVGKGDTCSCKDHPKAPKRLCKHLLSYHIFTRATALAKQRLAELDTATNGTTTLAPAQPTTEAPVAVPPQEPVVLAATPALPEAPASVNCHIMLEGRQIQVTLRDTDETRLLTRLAALLQQYPVAQPPTEPPTQSTGSAVPDENPYCHIHKVPLKKFSKHCYIRTLPMWTGSIS